MHGNGWKIPVGTDENGEYQFLDIGNEVAFLNIVVPGDREELRPMTTDLPVRVHIDRELIVNMAFHPEGEVPVPLLELQVVALSVGQPWSVHTIGDRGLDVGANLRVGAGNVDRLGSRELSGDRDRCRVIPNIRSLDIERQRNQ